MPRGPNYTREEEATIMINMEKMGNKPHREIMKRCQFISETFLPHRTPEAIREKYYALTGRYHDPKHVVEYEDPIKDLADLLDERQRKNIWYTLPRLKKYF